MKRSEWADKWWHQARYDLATAHYNKEGGFWSTCAMLCQQAAEKAVKAVWIDRKATDPPRVHNVGNIARELGAPDSVVEATNVLLGDYLASRYPDSAPGAWSEVYDETRAEDRLAMATEVLNWAEDQWEAQDETDRSSR